MAGMFSVALPAADNATRSSAGVAKDAAPKEDLAAVRKQIQSLQKSIEEAEGSRAETTDALRESEQAISATQRRLHELDGERRRINQRLDELGRDAEGTQSRIDAQRERIAGLLQRQYLRGDDDALRLLLGGHDPADLQRDLVAYRRILAARQQEIGRLQGQLQRLAELRADIDARRVELQGVQREQQAEARKLETQKAQHAATLARLGKDIEARRKQIETLKRDETRLTKLIERLAALKPPAPKAAKPRAPGTTGGAGAPPPIANEALPERGFKGDFAALRGRLRLPVRGEVVNRFGSPRADTGLAWKGLLIRADAGAPVLAVAPGRVAYADWLRGFGNLLIIDHGDGYMSLYGYNESLLRQPGETVASGEAVAKVGSSGGGEGSALYFELRQAGTPLDPLAWVGR
ncbi:MAG: peptidase M23 [Rhodocyclaceae bacterium]|nr:peptidase M23 [Rhodocyclaceae bacterium]